MMFKGRGGAAVAGVAALWLLLAVAEAAVTYKVGGATGWTFNTGGWLNGKRFRAGDILMFHYSPQAHNVVAVNKGGYDSCNAPAGASKFYSSGSDQIKLVKGLNFFICTFPGHCQSGMKIAVSAI
ncbi:hypothetical protein U1Q18_035415 [Sarracenia purpurea var. burkii]